MNEWGTSACSVIQGCWVGKRKEGVGLMEDTHGDKAFSYKDRNKRQASHSTAAMFMCTAMAFHT